MNRLSDESSPYLLQHSNNPVDWHPWGEEAFLKAREQDKPIFLSIGYSTCHWCHVMAEESFEDKEAAEIINRIFIPVKVDREERPDIDAVYMKAAVLATGRGGWPLTILMTPDKVPFFAATYIPKNSRYGMMGLMDLTLAVEKMWKTDRDQLTTSASSILNALKSIGSPAKGGDPDLKVIERAVENQRKRYDESNGGFGTAPKFPSPHQLILLMRYGKDRDDEGAVEMALNTLKKMRLGGIYDHLEGGFHRYSTDSKWLLPHFEKMLYDQAMQIMAYTEGYRIAKDPILKKTVMETVDYLMSRMKDPSGGFHSAEDADSDGEEGTFYLWSTDEVNSLLGKKGGKEAAVLFNMDRSGNFREEGSGRTTGRNVLHLSTTGDIAKVSEFKSYLKNARDQRNRPGKDDKILVDWNSLMISALSRSYQIFGDQEHLDAARAAADLILSRMLKEGVLYHSYRKGEASIPGMLDDHAFFGTALLDLYESTFDIKYLERALEIIGTMIERFWDEEQGGFFQTANDGETLLFRPKEAYDGAIPSGNSSAFHLLIRASRMTGDHKLEGYAVDIYRAFSDDIKRSPASHSWMLAGVMHHLGPAKEIVLVGNMKDEKMKEMIHIARNSSISNKVILVKDPNDDTDRLSAIAPFTEGSDMIDGLPTAYVCQGWNCDVPTNDTNDLRSRLSDIY